MLSRVKGLVLLAALLPAAALAQVTQVPLDLRGLRLVDASPSTRETLAFCDPDGDGWLQPGEFADTKTFEQARHLAALTLIYQASRALPWSQPPVDAELLAGVVVDYGRHLGRLEPVLEPLFSSVLVHAAGAEAATLASIAWISTWNLGEADRLRIARGELPILRGPEAEFVPTILGALSQGSLRLAVGDPAAHRASMLYGAAADTILVPPGLLTDPQHQRLVGFNLTPGIILHELRHALQDARRDPLQLVESEVQANVFEWAARIDALGVERAAELLEAMVLQSENFAGVPRDADPLRDRLLRAVDLALVDWGSLEQFDRLAFLEALSRNEDVELSLSDDLLTTFSRSRIARLLRVLVDRFWQVEGGELVGLGGKLGGAPPAIVALFRSSAPLTRSSIRKAVGPGATDDQVVEAWLLLLGARVGELYLEKGARAAQRWLERQLPRIERELIPLDMHREAGWNGLGAP